VKRIPEKIFVEWHRTGTKEHRYTPGVSNQAKNICRVCDVNTSGEKWGCQGMRFKDWLKSKSPTAREESK
jgi:hypothetical protein